jgi:diguanylate cyclase (GGDEF)-like protein
MRVAEQLKDVVANKTYNFSDESIRVTLSGGVAELALTKEMVSELVARTDNALYEAKRTGRNKIMPASWVGCEQCTSQSRSFACAYLTSGSP